MRGISWLAAKPVSFSRRTLLHGVSIKTHTMLYQVDISIQDHYFICQVSCDTSCWLACRIEPLNWSPAKATGLTGKYSRRPTDPRAAGTYLSNHLVEMGKSAAPFSAAGAWEHLGCLEILVYLLIWLVLWFFDSLIRLVPVAACYQSIRRHPTIKIRVHFAFLTLHFPGQHLQHPSL